MKEPKYISHITKDSTGRIIALQSNEEHCCGVAKLARKFAEDFGMGDFGFVMGMLHDKGKEKGEFQNYIRFENGLLETKSYTHDGKAHAYVGGLLARHLYMKESSLMGNPIMGHHRGLYDWTDYEDVSCLPIPPEIQCQDFGPISLPTWFHPLFLKQNDFHHIERMLFSCLVDADFLDTERFVQPGQFALRGRNTDLKELLPKLQGFLRKFGEPKTEINRIRNEIQMACLDKSSGAPGFYSLTVPTGGGKTLSSLLWAMNHAIQHGKKRIIIAIPYTSIIVQTAAVLRSIFGEENVLEHHSNVSVIQCNDDDLTAKMKLATENWDYPIVVTTNVQLFESMLSNRTSDCRKLHNICNSVLILDEIQTLPIDFMQPIVDSLDTYQRIFGVSVLFTTASQPVLTGNHQGTNPNVVLRGLKHVEEIIPDGYNLHNRLRRVDLDFDSISRTYDEVAKQLASHDRVLCIVNTRRDAKEIFDRLPDEGIRIHLSRMMCPAHVSEKIQEIKDALSNPGNKVIRVISTQLIEAGVDIDFPVVYRQEAGLDSILQAAGRCNREGKQGICTTHVFSLDAEHPLPKGFITQCNNARRNMGSNIDWFSPEAMTSYFHQLYSRTESFDRKDIKYYLYNPAELMFETAASEFRLIDDVTTSVIVNWRDSLSLVKQLMDEGPSYYLMKRLGLYSVNLRKHDLEKMKEEGTVEEIVEDVYLARNRNQYDDFVGLLTDSHWLEETYII